MAVEAIAHVRPMIAAENVEVPLMCVAWSSSMEVRATPKIIGERDMITL